MRPTLLYRVAAVLLVLFTVGHTVGFRQVALASSSPSFSSLRPWWHGSSPRWTRRFLREWA